MELSVTNTSRFAHPASTNAANTTDAGAQSCIATTAVRSSPGFPGPGSARAVENGEQAPAGIGQDRVLVILALGTAQGLRAEAPGELLPFRAGRMFHVSNIPFPRSTDQHAVAEREQAETAPDGLPVQPPGRRGLCHPLGTAQ